MKLIFTLLFSFALVVTGFSQSTRLVLLEEFTSSTCGPCAGVNPSFHTWQVQNPDKFTSIYYHVSWPAPGNDPMYLADKLENNARVSFYGVNYVPFSNLDGNYYNGNASGWNMTTVNTRQAMPSPFELKVQHRVSAGNDSVYVTMLAKVTQDITAPMTAQNVVIEKHVHFATPPGTNGETDFYDVMKKMLPGVSGTTLPTAEVVGDYTIVEGAWKFGIVYDVTQIAAVSFIQNKSSKEIYQAANSSTDPLVMPYSDDLQILEITNLPTTSCLGKLTPVVKVRNNGNNTVTSFQVKYSVGSGTLSTYTWNGTLQSLQKTVITLPEYDFNAQTTNLLKIYTDSPNNVADEYAKNDTLAESIPGGPSTTNAIYLAIRTDSVPQETSWDVKNSLGQVIKSSTPYTQKLHLYHDTILLPVADCYSFTIYDAGGNGLCCAHGNGGYELTDSQGTTIVGNGGTFLASETSEFKLEPAVGITNQPAGLNMQIYPNPFTDKTTLSFHLDRSEDVSLAIYNMVGQQILSRNLGTLAAGAHETLLEGQGMQPGIYLLQLKSGNLTVTHKVSVIR